MRMKLALSFIALAFPVLLSADPAMFNVKEGLWEVTTSHSTSGMPGMSDDALAKMPPDQRARVEEMMKQRGISMNGGTTVVKSCVNKEKVAKGMAFASENHENCTRNVTNSSTSHLEVKYHCDETRKDGNKVAIDGTTTIDVVSADSTKGTTHAITSSNGHNMSMDITFTSKYLGPDCGDVK